MTIIKTIKGNIFGGYSSISWASEGSKIQDPNAFLFSINRNKKMPTRNPKVSVKHKSSLGPTFGEGYDIYIGNPMNAQDKCFSNPKTYPIEMENNFSIFADGTKEWYFQIEELEVYQVIF